MNLSNLADTVTRVAGRQILTVQKNSPVILFAGGIVGVVGTVVLASRATLKLETVLDESLARKEKAHQLRVDEPERYSEKDVEKDLVAIKTKTALNIVKLYAPAFVLGVSSVAMLAGSNNILNKRSVAAIGALKMVEKQFEDYRKRVENELGEEKAAELLEGYTVEVDNDNGKGKKKVKVSDPLGKSPYQAIFDQTSSHRWRPGEGYNQNFLGNQQQWATERLRARGYLFLNDVLESLGMERTGPGQLVGWFYDPDDEKRDNYVSFGIFEREQSGTDFVNGLEQSVVLNFNCDGVVYDLLDESKAEAKKRRKQNN